MYTFLYTHVKIHPSELERATGQTLHPLFYYKKLIFAPI